MKSKANLQRHELRHQENRERNFICSVCGFKTFEKTILTLHMRTHDRNREKKHKCEHCEKAFFNSGALTIHRRIHLGQMIKCSLCPKEFFRQVDVDRHMPSHSLAPLSTNNSSVCILYVWSFFYKFNFSYFNRKEVHTESNVKSVGKRYEMITLVLTEPLTRKNHLLNVLFVTRFSTVE